MRRDDKWQIDVAFAVAYGESFGDRHVSWSTDTDAGRAFVEAESESPPACGSDDCGEIRLYQGAYPGRNQSAIRWGFATIVRTEVRTEADALHHAASGNAVCVAGAILGFAADGAQTR